MSESPLDILSRAAAEAANSPEHSPSPSPPNNNLDVDAPLDFSMKGRPSVIVSADPALAQPLKKRFKVEPTSSRRRVTQDDDADEHFKRSLGLAQYKTIFHGKEPPATAPEAEVGTVGCSVDDHFAKALGRRKWAELNASK